MKTTTLLLLAILAVVAMSLAIRTARPLHATTLPQAIAKDPDFLRADLGKSNYRIHSRQYGPKKRMDTCVVLGIIMGVVIVISLVLVVVFLVKKKR